MRQAFDVNYRTSSLGDIFRRYAVCFSKNVEYRCEAQNRPGFIGFDPRGTIFIPGGTTTLELARLLPPQRKPTVITNAMRAANSLIDIPGNDLVQLGGADCSGEPTMQAHLKGWGVNQFRVDKLVYGSDAIYLQQGIKNSQIIEVSTDWAIVTDNDSAAETLEGLRATIIQVILA